MANHNIHPYLPEADLVVLDNLFQDVDQKLQTEYKPSDPIPAPETIDKLAEHKTDLLNHDQEAIDRLRAWNDPSSPDFRPTVFVSWDDKDIPPWLNDSLVRPYARIASKIIRNPTDVVFFTHILLYLFVNLPSAILLYRHFTWIHGVAHSAFTFWCTGSFTLMMHNHIHNNGVLARNWLWLDYTFPYVCYPLMGHTWNSYYYHHVKHHHVEGNGPDDLSSTLRYQRDDIWNFLHYVGRFLFFIWFDLPLYFLRKNKISLACQAFCFEVSGLAFLYYMTIYYSTKASIFVLVIPFTLLRLGLMIGNWGQHALVDELEPDSDFRSSITLVDVPSNRFCFNDGYHTAHHLNPRRHWREQPVHFLQSKEAYRQGRALVFHNIDYLMMTFKLVQKDYFYLANCLVPMGDQIGMTQQEIADMLRTKTRRFTEEEIVAKFGKQYAKKSGAPLWHAARSRFAGVLPSALGLMLLGPAKVEGAKQD